VQRTVFGTGPEAIEAVINGGTQNYGCKSKTGGDVLLPPFGFLIESPTFIAFRALSWNKLSYASAPLFTLRSMDGLPLERSAKIRVYHGFGDARLRLGSTTHTVEKEAVVSSSP
jgi:hypothetical protein